MLRTNHWTAFNAASILASVLAWFPFLVVLGSVWSAFEMFGSVAFIHTQLLPEPRFWLAVMLSVGGSCFADVAVESFHRQVKPADYEILQEAEAMARRVLGRARAGVGEDGNDVDALPLHHATPAGGGDGSSPSPRVKWKVRKGDSWHSSCGFRTGSVCPTRPRRKSRNLSVMEVVHQERNESNDWSP
jgi:hypothetical protein